MTGLLATAISLPGRLAPCDLSLNAGELTVLVGPNGAGKTSLLHALVGIGGALGTVSIDGADLQTAGLARRRKLLSFLGASRDVRWPLAARDYVALALDSSAPAEAAEAALQRASALAFADRPLDRLSTGERTRVMIARAVAPQAKVLLLDEPCANLDPRWQLAAIDLLRAEAERGAAVLLSVHDLVLARDHADRIIVMDGGHIVADGSPSVLTERLLEDVFGVGWDPAGRMARC